MAKISSLRFLGLLLALALFAALFELGRRDVVTDNEGQRATPPAEMLRTGDFVIPTINGKDYLSKPPLLYWVIAGVYKLTGTISPVTARLPTALCFVALVLGIYLAVRREAGEMPARWAAVAFLASPYVLERARCAGLDVPLTLAVFFALVLYRAACRSEAAVRTALLTALAGVALGAAILLKGPAPFLFLAAACLAQLAVNDEGRQQWIKPGIYGTLAALGLGVLLWLATAVAPGALQWLRFPVALALLAAIWVVLAWRQGDPGRARFVWLFLATTAVGLAVAAPWCAAVVSRKGWPYVWQLLQSETLERTHTATAINSGHPLYYFIGLIGMLAPWGLLLHCQLSRSLWLRGTPLYRFSVLSAWLSVCAFSLIAGKEYEYVLPAVPFLLIATGHHLSEITAGAPEAWVTRWTRVWRDAMLGFLAVAGVGVALYAAATERHPVLIVEAAILAAVTLALGWHGWKHEARRLGCVAGMALCVILIGLLSQAYHFTGQHSHKTIARTAADLLRRGYDVEAVKMTTAFDVFPGFAFYAGINVPTVLNPARVRDKLRGASPYFCVLRAQFLAQASGQDDAFAQPLLGPYRKGLVLIGNRPLPEGK